ncbi:MAG: HDOD domain-containing protein [Gammaproteobacteria bacterium]|nr:HDOD domain-containing protein [Gammaproteobacteria bacterium]
MIAYVARQPILDVNENTIGYELLFRDGPKNSFPSIDPNEATTKIIARNQLTLGIEQICQNKLAFINFHEECLLHHFPTSLEKKSTVIEILEDISISEDLIEVCQSLYKQGYTLALDDHEFEEQWRVLYPFIKIIKVDITDFSTLDLELFSQFVANEYPHITLLAERVETEKQFATLKALGYTQFQGYFFAKPEIIEQNTISPSKIRLLNLIGLISNPTVTFDEIAEQVETDPAISFKLLRFISSSSYARGSKITSLRHALSYLGLYEIRKFIALIAIAKLNEDRAEEIIRLSLLRAKFCEYIEVHINKVPDLSSAYLVGLLSLLPIVLKTEPTVVLSKLPVSKEIKAAIHDKKDKFGAHLMFSELYEVADWESSEQLCKELDILKEEIGSAYIKAVDWLSNNPL